MIFSVLILPLFFWLLILLFVDVKFSQGVRMQKTRVSDKKGANRKVDVVMAVRNEEKTIEQAIRSVLVQEEVDVKVIVVNDHSTDETELRIDEMIKEFGSDKIELHQNTFGEGKKAALRIGIKQVSNEFVFLTDGDCFLNSRAIYASVVQLESTQSMVCLGVVQYLHSDLWQRVLALENLNTMAVTVASVSANIPVFANGGNMLLTRDVLSVYESSLGGNQVSGDDVFFLQKLRGQEIAYTFSMNSVVDTLPPSSFKMLLLQRLRWANKSNAYTPKVLRFVPLIIGGLQFLIVLGSFILAFYSWQFVVLFYLSKWLIEYSFQKTWFRHFGESYALFESMLLSAIYPFYVTAVAIASILKIPVKWKGRNI